ncbi:MAG: RecX family transcriptional regulator [Chitinophagaceae bacterium]|nr:RecX family transcriptional regulator [Chitinophagaceae bacterium]
MKLKHYCAYQERCHQEVKEKAYSFGLRKTDVEQLISKLIEEDYLNEERFARQFVGGHFRLKKWGIIKIKYALKQKRVSDYNIKKGLLEIDEEAYRKTALQLIKTKWKAVKKDQYLVREAKTQAYLAQKGFEPGLVQALIKIVRDEAK